MVWAKDKKNAGGMGDGIHPGWSLRDFLTVVFRRRGLLFRFALIIMVVGIGRFFMIPDMYESQARILLNPEISRPLPSGGIDTEGNGSNRMMRQRLNAEIAIMEADQLSMRVVDRVGPENYIYNAKKINGKEKERLEAGKIQYLMMENTSVPESDGNEWKPVESLTRYSRTIRTFRQNLFIRGNEDSNIITIAFRAPNPYLARQSLDCFVRFYLEAHKKAHGISNPVPLWETRTREAESTLNSTEARLNRFKADHGIGFLDKQIHNQIDLITALKKDIDQVKGDMNFVRAKIAAFEGDGLAPSIPPGDADGPFDGHINRLELKAPPGRVSCWRPMNPFLLPGYRPDSENGFRTMGGRENPDEWAIRAVLTEEHGSAPQPPPPGPGVNLMRERIELSALSNRLHTLREQLTVREGELSELIRLDSEYKQLQREAELLEKEFLQSRNNLYQARLDQEENRRQSSFVSVIQTPSASLEPVSRNAWRLAGWGAVIFALGGLILMFLAEVIDHSVKTPDEVEKYLDLPVLGDIPREVYKKNR